MTGRVLDYFSSFGGSRSSSIATGTRQCRRPSTVRQKPDFVGPDGVNTTFFGFTLSIAGITDSSNDHRLRG